jgi:hypothetical protein
MIIFYTRLLVQQAWVGSAVVLVAGVVVEEVVVEVAEVALLLFLQPHQSVLLIRLFHLYIYTHEPNFVTPLFPVQIAFFVPLYL